MGTDNTRGWLVVFQGMQTLTRASCEQTGRFALTKSRELNTELEERGKFTRLAGNKCGV